MDSPDPLDLVLDWHTGTGDPSGANEDRDREYWNRARAFVRTYGRGQDVVERLAFLRVVGTPEELTERLDKLEAALAAVSDVVYGPDLGVRPGFFSELEYGENLDAPEEVGPAVLDGLRELARYVHGARAESEAVVQALERDGFTYNADEDRLELRSDGPGRPAKAVSEVVARVYRRIRPRYREETSDDRHTPRPLLARIRAALSPAFPSELLEDDALRSALQSRKPWR